MSLRSTPVCSLSKLGYVAVIFFLQGRSKEIRYITVNGRYLLEENFSNANIP
jgi:hypothetical protein